MIKGDYFGKLLKPLFSILLIGFFGLLGNSFVNAQALGEDMSHDLPYNFYIDSNFESIYKDLNFESNGGNWLYKQYSNNAVRSIFWNNGRLYTYFYENVSTNYQGYFDKVCKIYSETGFLPSLGPICNNDYEFTTTGYNEFYNLTNPNFTKVISPELYNFNYYSPVLCFYDSVSQYFYCFNLENHNGGSLNIGGPVTDFSNYAENSPFGDGQGGSQGSVVVDPDSTYTGDYTYTECTFSNVYNQLNNMGYNPYLCYGGLDNYDNLVLTGIYNAQPGTGVNMLGIYTHSSHNSDKQSWFNYWNTSYINQYVSSRDIWYDEPASLYFLFKYYNEYGGNNLEFLSVWEYCNIDWIVNNMSTMPDSKYTGSNFQYVCDIIKAKDIMNGIGGNDGENVEGLNWDGVGVLSGGKTYNDPGQFITDMFTKIKSYIPADGSSLGLGFLPTYIITFMLFLMLFRFLSH